MKTMKAVVLVLAYGTLAVVMFAGGDWVKGVANVTLMITKLTA